MIGMHADLALPTTPVLTPEELETLHGLDDDDAPVIGEPAVEALTDDEIAVLGSLDEEEAPPVPLTAIHNQPQNVNVPSVPPELTDEEYEILGQLEDEAPTVAAPAPAPAPYVSEPAHQPKLTDEDYEILGQLDEEHHAPFSALPVDHAPPELTDEEYEILGQLDEEPAPPVATVAAPPAPKLTDEDYEILGQLDEEHHAPSSALPVDHAPPELTDEEYEILGQLDEHERETVEPVASIEDVHLTDDDVNTLAQLDETLPEEVHAVLADLPEPASELTEEEHETLAGLDVDETVGVWNKILGDAVKVPSSDVRKEFEQHLEKDTPVLRRLPVDVEVRDWQLDFGPVWAPAGYTSDIEVSPQCLFRGEKIMATDTADQPGTGTRIMAVTVGQKIQRPNGVGGTLTKFFDASALGNGILFDTAQAWAKVMVTVSFTQSCTFNMSVFGKSVL